ncbi:CRISPR-associated helicase Cas3' [Oceanotoga sp. DSM 15011]|uniref:CRISPR-associated helicase Cas3' n=1 Tax=Oceanotoga sp. DSM 15011 TaxID=2984951 RepID=UPI0021F3EAF7|nr:CRISPR-associated helicase Cas3' [Oceanotoga sp. DSM 15011]UYP01347.1 CRISPR-associated helicase Cas3' [Oceanotoga sp. DSM 15011]
MEFYSHPDKALYNHLLETYEFGKNQIDFENIEIYKIIAYSHDIGKYTTYFQNHLFGIKESNLSDHSYISALFGSFIGLKIGLNFIDILIIYNVINNHHGNIKNIDFYESSYNEEKIQKQILDLKNNKKDIIKSISKINFQNEFLEFIEDFNYKEHIKMLNSYIYSIKKNKNLNNYFKHQELYSALVYSDKLSASKIKENQLLELQTEKIFKEYKKTFSIKNTNFMNDIRNKIYEEIQKNCENIEKKDKIITITAPTGTGKTYSGFLAALKIKQRFNKKKIIYVLPYTSIIDQNYEKIKILLKTNKEFHKKESQYIIKHHYLSKKEYIDDKERYTNSQSEILFESWDSNIIVTTYVQLLETIISNKNRYLKKYNQIKDSIVILDEIQTVDIKFYYLIEKVIEKFSEKYEVPFLIMTATKPIIFQNYKELLMNNKDFFSKFNRIKLNVNLEKITIDEITKQINEIKNNNSILIICNTIKESLEIYNNLKSDKSYYLSTNILPIDRKKK